MVSDSCAFVFREDKVTLIRIIKEKKLLTVMLEL